MKKKAAKAAPKKTMMKRPAAKKAPQQMQQQASPVPAQQAPQPPMGTPAPGTNGPMMRKGGTIKKKAKAGFDLNKDGKTTFKDVLIGRGVLPKKAKCGTKMKKAQIGTKFGDMGKSTSMPGIPTRNNAGSSQQKMNDNIKKINMSDAASSMKKNMAGLAKTGKSMKKAQTGEKLYPTSGVGGKDMPAKSGKSMKKCKYGCK